ncbi:P-loop containing nucleoside triphosphate hydrolase protein [Acrodontium crateriforme]|uniref:P-loop containing nucleoside triphosphate hydrolase protein n=1 Tax=Acrodontium crateriforme TaxID=150365 RepID=A0AAQ3MBN7_9PEZI|nr:P-loop containing nucleoside triphosphate hydrolase protein [Acrodontium crateriforme]
MEQIATHKLKDVVELLRGRIQSLAQNECIPAEQRMLIALAGVPGSGKSTVSAALLQLLQMDGRNDISILTMDGFHHTTEELSRCECPDVAFRRRGAPFTFDGRAFVNFVKKLKTASVTEENDHTLELRAPSFDHGIQDPIPDDVVIPSTAKIIIVEGNYVLLNQSPWNELSRSTTIETARQRLIARHIKAGIETSEEEAAIRVDENDMVNAELILCESMKPQVIVVN